MNILIAGGTGLIGKKLTQVLAAKGHRIFSLSRRERKSDSQSVEFIVWNGKEIPETKHEFDALVNLAGEPVMDKMLTKERKKQIIESRTASTFAFVDFISKAKKKPSVFINASAVGYYGDRATEILTEDSFSGKGFLSEVCRQWEKAASYSPIRTVVLRTGIVLSNDGGAFKEIMRSYALGFGNWFGSGEQGFPWIHIDDEIGLILFAIENKNMSGAMNVTAPVLISNKVFIQTLGRVSGKRFAFGVPAFAMQLVLGERAQLVFDSQFVKPEKALQSGYQFNFPDAESALKNLLNQ